MLRGVDVRCLTPDEEVPWAVLDGPDRRHISSLYSDMFSNGAVARDCLSLELVVLALKTRTKFRKMKGELTRELYAVTLFKYETKPFQPYQTLRACFLQLHSMLPVPAPPCTYHVYLRSPSPPPEARGDSNRTQSLPNTEIF